MLLPETKRLEKSQVLVINYLFCNCCKCGSTYPKTLQEIANAIGYLPKLDKDPMTEYTTYLVYKTWRYQAGTHVGASSILASFHGLECPMM